MVDLGPFFFYASTTRNEWIVRENWAKKENSVSLEKTNFRIFYAPRLTNSLFYAFFHSVTIPTRAQKYAPNLQFVMVYILKFCICLITK